MLPRILLALLALTPIVPLRAADLSVRFYPFEGALAHPGGDGWLDVIVEMQTPGARAGAHVRITHDPAVEILDAGHWMGIWQCERLAGQVDCRNPEIVQGGDGHFTLKMRAPAAAAGGEFEFKAEVTATPADPNLANNSAVTTLYVIPQHIVSNTNDSGPGSLRAAIENANATCTEPRPCEIKFRFGGTAVPVVEPLSPLPPLTACGVLVGERPPHGGKAAIQIEVNGRHVGNGPGLQLRSACPHPFMSLYGMAVNGFPGDGIAITSPGYYLLNAFAIGTDAAGTRAIPNGQRGIAVTAQAATVVTDSLIGGNVRSGIALFNGSAVVTDTRIGAGADGRDLGNGASGIYVAPTAFDLTVRNAIIANHPHYGLALAGQRVVNISTDTVIRDNILDVDWRLDGPTANSDADAIPNTPRVLSAVFDPAAGVTRVTVSLQAGAAAATNMQVRLYASKRVTIFGTAHLERLAATKYIAVKQPIAEPVTVEIPGDLRGTHVSAVTTHWTVKFWDDAPEPSMYSTSETSAAVRVE